MENNGWLTMDQLAERIQALGNEYDEYIEYIENWKQYEEAKRRNARISKNINLMGNILEEMGELIIQCTKKHENAVVYYKKGNFKLTINNETKGYKKSKYSK